MSKKRIPQITIGADYFRTTVRKESVYPLAWRWAKETLQNSYDADASKFIVNLYEDERSAEVIDNGYGMNEDTLLDVFLSVGGTKKDADEDGIKPIGGFGDAKKVVCFCWDRWEIHTQDNYLNNELLGVELEKTNYIEGTRIKVWMEDEFSVDSMVEYFSLCQLDIIIEVNILKNDEVIKTLRPEKLRRNKLINDLGFARLYANKSKATEMLIVRLNGLALFTEQIDGIKATCVLELESSVDPKSKEYMLNVTREQLTWKYRSQIHAVIMDMLSNPVKALKPRKEERLVIMKGIGACLSVSSSTTQSVSTIEILVDDYLDRFKNEEFFEDLKEHEGRKINIRVPDEKYESIKDFINGMNFVELMAIINQTRKTRQEDTIDALKCPVIIDVISDCDEKNALQEIFPYDIVVKGKTKKRYDGVKYQRLLLAWHKTIQYVCYYNTWNENHIDLGDYQVGFVFEDDVLAQRCVVGGVPCYLLNPSDLNFQDYTWRGIVLQLIDRATHEVAHNYEKEHNGNFVATWNLLKSYMYMYIDDLMYSLGLIIKSTKKELVENANLNEVFSYDE